ncbi:MAG: hypothetical protein WBK55_02300 [Alphaproteobacteria bacterium]
MKLYQIHKRMLRTENFNIDGGNTTAGKEAAMALLDAGYVTMFESGSDEATRP